MVVFQKPFSVFRQMFRESRKSEANIGKIEFLPTLRLIWAQTIQRNLLERVKFISTIMALHINEKNLT